MVNKMDTKTTKAASDMTASIDVDNKLAAMQEMLDKMTASYERQNIELSQKLNEVLTVNTDLKSRVLSSSFDDTNIILQFDTTSNLNKIVQESASSISKDDFLKAFLLVDKISQSLIPDFARCNLGAVNARALTLSRYCKDNNVEEKTKKRLITNFNVCLAKSRAFVNAGVSDFECRFTAFDKDEKIGMLTLTSNFTLEHKEWIASSRREKVMAKLEADKIQKAITTSQPKKSFFDSEMKLTIDTWGNCELSWVDLQQAIKEMQLLATAKFNAMNDEEKQKAKDELQALKMKG